jgi:hypothetical protein
MENIFAPILQCAAIFVILTLATAATFFYRQRAYQRQKELRGWAQTKRFNFSRPLYDGSETFSEESELLPARGTSTPSARNVVEGIRNGIPFKAFDCHFEPNALERRRMRDFSAVIVKSPLPLKPLLIYPADKVERIRFLLGFNALEPGCRAFKSASAAFNRKFHLQAADLQWASAVLHPKMTEFLLASPAFALRFGVNEVMAYRKTTFTVSDIDAAVDLLGGIYERFPEYLLK